jgi:hypothetical protein
MMRRHDRSTRHLLLRRSFRVRLLPAVAQLRPDVACPSVAAGNRWGAPVLARLWHGTISLRMSARHPVTSIAAGRPDRALSVSVRQALRLPGRSARCGHVQTSSAWKIGNGPPRPTCRYVSAGHDRPSTVADRECPLSGRLAPVGSRAVGHLIWPDHRFRTGAAAACNDLNHTWGTTGELPPYRRVLHLPRSGPEHPSSPAC